MAGQDESHTNIAPLHAVRKEAAPLERGAVLAGRYQIEGLLGRGGAGVVLRAFDRELHEAVAIKVLHADLAQEARWVERLAREVKLARQLRHPNVCRVFDFEKADGHVFIVMELAAGGSLRRELADRALPARSLAERLADARAVAEGLAAIHAGGVAHRDVTPQNVLRMADGRLVVSDFGLATEISQTTTSIQGGTIAYMSPEVVRGQRANLASDVWSLGVVIHEIVFGARPNWSKPVGGAMLTPAPGRTLAPGERLVYDVCRACTADQPSTRPQSAGEVAARLRGERPRSVSRRARWLVLALAAVGASVGAARLLRTRPSADGQAVLELTGVAADWTKTSTVHASVEGRIDCLRPLPDHKTVRYVQIYAKRAEDLDLSSGRRGPSPLAPETYEHGCPDVSPDDKRLAYQGYVPDGRAFAFVSEQPDGSDGRPAVAIADPSHLSEPTWLADSDAFAIDVDYLHAGVFSLNARRTTVLPDVALQTSVSNFRAVFGSTILLMANRTVPRHAEIVGYQWPTLAEVLRVRVPDTAISVGSPDGRVLFLPSYEGAEQLLTRVDPATRTMPRVAKIPGQWIRYPTFLPDRMVFVSRRDLVDAWRRRADGQMEQLTHEGQISSIKPCGSGYIATRGTGTVVQLDAAGRVQTQLAERPEIEGVGCTPDAETWFAIVGQPETGVLRCGKGGCERLTDFWTPYAAISPNGERFATVKASAAGYVAEWRATKGREDARVPHEIGITESNCPVSWSSDRALWLSKRRNGRLLWVEVDVDTRAETGNAIEGAHGCTNSVPDPQSPSSRDLRVIETSTSEIRSVPLSAVGVSASL